MKKLSKVLRVIGIIFLVLGVIMFISRQSRTGAVLLILAGLSGVGFFLLDKLSQKKSKSSPGTSRPKNDSDIIVYNPPEIVTLKGKDGKIRMRCFALVPYMKKIYAVMKLKDRLEGVDPDGAFVFLVTEDPNDDSPNFSLIDDDDIIDPVLYRYNHRR